MSDIPPELEPHIAKTTAELSAIISKPKMVRMVPPAASFFSNVLAQTACPCQVDKHLAKPPFRFIHDIVSELTAVTG